jgi:hypothetical protein
MRKAGRLIRKSSLKIVWEMTMKKLLLLTTVFLGIAVSAFAQGTIRFANTGSPIGYDFRLWTNRVGSAASNLMSGAGQYRIALYGSTDPGASAGSLTLIASVLNSPAAGIFSGGDPFILPDGYAPSTLLRFQLRAWTATAGATWAEVLANLANGSLNPLNTYTGASDLGLVILGGGTVQQAALFGTNSGQLTRGFEITNTPEPSSIALGLLGLGAMALFRRKK